MPANSGFADVLRGEVLRLLGAVLADEVMLASQARLYAWNVVGPQFPFLQPFFREQQRELDGFLDAVAERVRQLGGLLAPLSGVLANARLPERPAPQPSARDMVANLLADHEALIASLRDDSVACGERLQDRVTMNFLTDLQGRHERLARVLRSMLEAPSSETDKVTG
jgi:starvation-inducible DNA-binding protein